MDEATRLPALCSRVLGESEDVWRPALSLLVELIDVADGEDAATIGVAVRELGVVDQLAMFTVHEDPEVHQAALLALANLASDAFDERSALTKDMLREAGVFECVVCHVCTSEDDETPRIRPRRTAEYAHLAGVRQHGG